MKTLLRLTIYLALLATSGLGAATKSPIAWQPWSEQQFAQAKKEQKFILLDLEAVWCHIQGR